MTQEDSTHPVPHGPMLGACCPLSLLFPSLPQWWGRWRERGLAQTAADLDVLS